jgi:hypothetical protein
LERSGAYSITEIWQYRGNDREVTIGTAHTVTVNSLIELNKQTIKQTSLGHLRNTLTLLPPYHRREQPVHPSPPLPRCRLVSPIVIALMATPRLTSHVQQSRLEACWREQNCSSCLRNSQGCGWCAQVCLKPSPASRCRRSLTVLRGALAVVCKRGTGTDICSLTSTLTSCLG